MTDPATNPLAGEESGTPADSDGASMPLGARIHRLQRIVADLEREDIELEDAMQLFEEGVGHLRAADSLLSRAELRIERLLETRDGVGLEDVEDE
jgi:exodeoxyribonuclease VII small subunit